VALPTAQQIAAMLRRRPLGSVIVEICSDLGIAPGDIEAELWTQVSLTIEEYGGSLSVYLTRLADRLWGPMPERHPANEAPAPQSCPPVPLVLATGPP
jgi:hypothetical protein